MTRDHSVESQINLIFESMDWEKIYQIFKVCQYTYAKNLFEDYDPEIKDLQNISKQLLEESYYHGRKNNCDMIFSSGRFEASWNNTDETLSLRFIPEEKEIMLDEANEAIYVT